MKILGILKPEYIYQPGKAIRQLFKNQKEISSEFIEERLPWGLPIRICPEEEHGKILQTLGVIDLGVSEVLYRLAEAGEIAVDVGANIGYMTSLLANRVNQSKEGLVIAYEAHPEVFKELQYNIQLWQERYDKPRILIENRAVSDQVGEVLLGIPKAFADNRGLSAVISMEVESAFSNSTSVIEYLAVASTTLDTQFSKNEKIGVLKIDVEGHELSVLKGAKELLSQKRIRDCIFEEHQDYPTAVTSYLESFDYTLFRIQRSFWGPQLLPANSSKARLKWLPTSFLATVAPERAFSRLRKKGWRVLERV